MYFKLWLLTIMSCLCIVVNSHLFYMTLDFTLIPAVFIGMYILVNVLQEYDNHILNNSVETTKDK